MAEGLRHRFQIAAAGQNSRRTDETADLKDQGEKSGEVGRTVGRPCMLSARERAFVEARRVAHLATADRAAVPQVVPVCFGLAEDALYITIDQKPKRAGRLMEDVTLTNKYLLYLSFVNMDKGIGRGW